MDGIDQGHETALQTIFLTAGSDLFPSCTLVNSLLFPCFLLFSSSLAAVCTCRGVMQSSAGMSPRTGPKYPHAHKLYTQTRTHTLPQPAVHLQTLLPMDSDLLCITGISTRRLLLFSLRGRTSSKERTVMSQRSHRFSYSTC